MKDFGVESVVFPDLEAEIGDNIRIVSGAFKDFVGSVEEINIEKRKVKAFVSIFGRDTSVEVDFDDVEKI